MCSVAPPSYIVLSSSFVRKLPASLDFDRWVYLTTKLTAYNPILRTFYLCLEAKKPKTALQVVLKHPIVNLRYQSFTGEDEKEAILNAEWVQPFAPAMPAVRYTLMVNTEDDARFLVVKLDHASYDGSLLHIFDEQFRTLAQNKSLPYHTPFKDFINYVTAIPKEPQLSYWANVLRDQTFDFPSALANPSLSSGEMARMSSAIDIDSLAASCHVTTPIVFQTAYTLLLAHLSGASEVVYDNFVTGRNVSLDNPQLINGNCANFLPFHAAVLADTPYADLLQATQAAFWKANYNGLVSLGDIYDNLAVLGSGARRAKCLFCFQPFEAAPADGSGGEQDAMRWIVMKMGENRMAFNYAVQLEVRRGPAKGEYVVRFEYD